MSLYANENEAEVTNENILEFTSFGFEAKSLSYDGTKSFIYCAIRTPQKEPVNSSEVFAIDD